MELRASWPCILVVALGAAVNPPAVNGGAIHAVTHSTHSCAVTTGGALSCWGGNSDGQLGDGTTIDRFTPVPVAGLESGVVAVEAGTRHTCAVTSAGALWCWGDNRSGQLGIGTTTSHLTPVAVAALGSDVVTVTAGNAHTCAITSAGALWCWGNNAGGKLGDGTSTTRTTPVAVSGLASGVVAVTAGDSHTCAVTSGGALSCWGENRYGQLGIGGSSSRLTPAPVVELGSGVTAVAAGNNHTCAVASGGAVLCWGSNGNGQLGDGTTTTRTTPVAVSGLGNGVVALAVGFTHTCAVTNSGAVLCWGDNAYGQLGDGTTTSRPTFVAVSGLGSGVVAVAAGDAHSCAVTADGSVLSWGRHYYGELGDGTTTQQTAPVAVSGLDSGVMAVAAGGAHSCALKGDGALFCWGANYSGALGDGTTTDRTRPVAVSGLDSGVMAVAAGGAHTCALKGDGALFCWGSNFQGAVGDGTTTDRTTPVAVSALGSGVAAVAAGGHHTCAVTSGGALFCWGDNYYGQLGDGTTAYRITPVAVSGLGSGVVAVAAGWNHTCAVTNSGVLSCWGRNSYGQLGDGPGRDRRTPLQVSALGSSVVAVTVGYWHTCAVTSGGAARCWGYNAFGQLGDGTTTSPVTPVMVSGLGSGVEVVTAGTGHTCAVASGGALFCWGSNDYGQLGDGTTTYRTTPVVVSGLGSGVLAVAAGWGHTCAVAGGGAVLCWGQNFRGQLGNGVPGFRATPVRTIGLPGEAVRYFAEGANGVGMGFETRLALLNPHDVATWASLEFQTTSGATINHGAVALGAHQRVTVDTWQDVPWLADASFSTVVRSTLPVVADRTMRWDASGHASHAETAIAAPSLTWYLAEGATHSDFRLFYLLQNPNATAATVRVTYLLTGRSPITVTCTVPPRTRKNIYANQQLCPDDVYVGPRPTPDRLEGDDVSAVFEVTDGGPIIVERAMYHGMGFAAGTATAGVTSPATEWFLAEGATGDLFDTYVLLANPNGTDAEFELDLLRLNNTPSLVSPTTIADRNFCAPLAAPCPLVVPAHERRTIRLDGIPGTENDGVSAVVRVTNGVGVLVERAMWWPGPYATWTEGHASFGTTTTGTRWGLAEGEVGGPRGVATYVLVANASAFPAHVRATLMFEDGTTAATDLTVAANARANFNFTPATIAGYPELTALFPPATVVAGQRFGVLVESLPTGSGTAQIVVERAMYGGDGRAPTFLPYWPAGTNALATKLR